MKYLLIAAMFIVFAGLGRANEQGPADKPKGAASGAEGSEKDAKPPHEGVWKAIAAVLGGVRLPDQAVTGITLKVEGDHYEVTVQGEEHPDKGTCKLDTTTTPKRMTITSTDGANKGKTFLAIFEMKDAESLRVCYDLSGKEFPKEFKAPKDSPLFLVGYRRQKEQPSEKPAPK
jgi:uncharacterized protein (TIGR03067 family)